MKSNSKTMKALFFSVLALGLTACNKNHPSTSGTDSENGGGGSYFISTTAGGNNALDYLLTTNDLTTGELTVIGNGEELFSSGYRWVFPNATTTIGFKYQQGDPGIGLGYGVNSDGKLVKKGADFQILSRFTTLGVFSKYAVAAVSGVDKGGQQVSTFNFVNIENNNSLEQKEVVTTDMVHPGEFVTFSGILDMGNDEFLTGAVVSGLRDANAEGGASTGVVKYPDSVWVIKMDKDLQVKNIFRDNRISYASGRARSQYYSGIAKNSNGDVYVFSSSHEATTTKPAGALRIVSGANVFDPNYYFNIQEKANNLRFRKVWALSNDNFLLEFFNDADRSITAATRYAIVNVQNQTVKFITNGFPDFSTISSIGEPLVEGNKVFIPVNVLNEKPAIYSVDIASAIAVKGLTVNADAILSVGKLSQ